MSEHPPTSPLAVAVASAVGAVAVVWLMGYLGFRLGFAPLIDVPHLRVDPGAGLVTGIMMLVSIPRVIVLAGIAQPGWLMLGFGLIAVPAAGLGAVKTRPHGEPRPPLATVFSSVGAVAAAVNTLLVIAWAASSARNGRIDQLRVDPQDAEAWLTDLVTVAGIDVLVMIASALWVVLVLRLTLPRWLKALAATAAFFALVAAALAMSMSNASVAQLQKQRSAVLLEDGSVDARLVLGSTGDHVATLRVDEGVAVIELRDPGLMTVVGRQSIIGMLEQAAERERGRAP